MLTREQFLVFVEEYIAKDPESAAFVGERVQAGLRSALRASNERAVAMESLVALLVSRKQKGTDAFVKETLSRWRSRCSLAWDWYLGAGGER